MENKKCPCCGKFKDLNEYYDFKSTKKDFDTRLCKKCIAYKRTLKLTGQSFKTTSKKYRESYLTEEKKEMLRNQDTKNRADKYGVNYVHYNRNEILERDNWTCQKCGIKVHDRHTGNWNTPDKAHIDHIIPISKKGNSVPENFQVLCRMCNLEKKNKI